MEKQLNQESPIISVKNLSKKYGDDFVLNGININFFSGKSYAIVGPSGSGKSTLLHLIALLDSPTSGTVESPLLKENIKNFRKNHIGFVYQFHFLIDELTAIENILIASEFRNKNYANELLERFNLIEKAKNLPHELSGGQKQRIAIIRALINSPKIFIADEPTGNLDAKNADIIQNELLKITAQKNVCTIIATHDQNFASKMDSQIILKNNSIEIH